MKNNEENIKINCGLFYGLLLLAYLVVLLFLIILIQYYKEPLSHWIINGSEYSIDFRL